MKFEKAAIHFSDQSIDPPCTFDLQQFSGTIKGLSTQSDSVANVDVAGRVDEASPFALRGTMNPLAHDLSLNLVFTNRNLQLAPFTTYMEKYGGHRLIKGRLNLDLNYDVHQKALKARNKVEIDQLMLGPRNNSPEATKLPVKLALALLKDNSGRIELDLPVEGRLDDPQFSVASIALKIVVNLIVKTAASPFKLLGALVGGGEELSYVDFTPGQAQLVGAETNKLQKLIAALEKRPSLNLEIEGSVDPIEDREALARGIIREKMKSMALKEFASTGQTPPSTEQFQLDPVDYERLLRASMVKTFGTNLAEAVQAFMSHTSSTNTMVTHQPSTKNPGLFKRITSLFKPRKERAAIAQAHRQAKADELLIKQNPELATLTVDDMESALATRTDVPPDRLRQLMQDRAKAVQVYLLSSGKVAAERLYLIAPKTPDASFKGQSRVNLSID
ncbi:MAG: DUF748 domain-containing protein [Candidatus Omnitrophica bacterium]|nr:DUF748 domain-containing protein [Candidatus Omnitrophota bacterium]